MEKTMALSVKWMGAALTAILLAAVLLASPAFAQAQGGNVNVQYVDCSQVQTAVANQGQYGDAGAIGAGAAAAIAQELGITQEQVNACLGELGFVVEDKPPQGGGETTSEETTVASAAEGKVITSTIPEKKVLAATGGMPLMALLSFAMIGAGLSVLGYGLRRSRQGLL